MGSVDKWVQEVEAAVREKREGDFQRDGAFLAKRELLKDQKPVIWEKMCDAFRSYCQAYNEGAKTHPAIFQMVNKFVAAIGRDGSDIKLIVSNMPASDEIRLVGEGWEFYKAFEFAIITNGIGKVVLRADKGMVESPEMIAAMAIKELLVQSA